MTESAAKGDIPDWVADEIRNVKFEESTELKRTGYILETYDADNKIDMQLYEPVEDGRHIVTMDIPEEIKAEELQKGVIYEFVFDQHKAPLSERASEYLRTEKEIDMGAIYQFGLRSLEIVNEDNATD